MFVFIFFKYIYRRYKSTFKLNNKFYRYFKSGYYDRKTIKIKKFLFKINNFIIINIFKFLVKIITFFTPIEVKFKYNFKS